MVVCGKCAAENSDEAKFCRGCGESLATEETVTEEVGEFAECVRCKTRNAEGVKFCVKCGMPMDGSGICVNCETVIPSESKYCPKCGMRSDGQMECHKCGKILAKDETYCGECGERNGLQRYKAKSKPSGKRIVELVKCWSVAAIMLLLFLFNFAPIFSQTDVLYGRDVTTKVSGVDIIKGGFTLINAPSEDELQVELNEFMFEHPELISQDTDTAKQAMLKIEKIVNKFGALKMAITEEGLKAAPISMRTDIIIWTVMELALMALTLVFFIKMVIKAVKCTLGKKATDIKFEALGFSLVFALSVLFPLLSGGNMAAGSIAMAVFSALGLGGLIAYRYAVTKDTLQLRTVLAQGVSVVMAVVLLVCASSGAMKIEYKTSGEQAKIFKSYVTSMEQFLGVDLVDIDEVVDGKIVVSGAVISIDDYLKKFVEPKLNANLASGEMKSKDIIKIYLATNSLYSFAETGDYVGLNRTLSVVSLLLTLFAAASVAGLFVTSFMGLITGEKGKRNLFAILAMAAVAALMSLNIVNVIVANSVTKQLGITLKYFITPWLITGTIFGAGNILQNFLLDNSKKPLMLRK